tara:strand:- start:65977 stop:67146 length:1170 start_codon:yes stop_codon:yes gene_type:complete
MRDPITGKLTKSVFESMTLDEISAVDRPAMPTALASIMKRAPESDDKLNPFGKRALLTTPTNGHQHLLSDEVGPEMRAMSGQTGGEQDGDDRFHSHPWMIDPSTGSVVIGEVNGHTHQVLLSSQGGAQPNILDLSKQAEDGVPDSTDASTSSGVPADSVGNVPHEATMSEKNDQIDIDPSVAKQLEDLTKRAERAELVSQLNDAQTGIFKSLDADGQDAFLALSPEARQGEVAKAADADAVVYTDSVGVDYRKSDDSRLIDLAKAFDKEKEKREEKEEEAKKVDLVRRANDLQHLPGDLEARVGILKGIDALPVAEQGAALEALKSANEAMSKAFERAGTSAVPTGENPIDVIAKRLREANPSLTLEMAKADALDTPEGAAAYAKSLGL